jgi:hypothetical protein
VPSSSSTRNTPSSAGSTGIRSPTSSRESATTRPALGSQTQKSPILTRCASVNPWMV